MKAVKPIEWPRFYPGLDREGDKLIINLAEHGDFGRVPLHPLKLLQIVAMNLGFQITFDKKFDDAKDPWFREYVDNATTITTVRGASNTWSDFVPLLPLSPKFRRQAKLAEEAAQKRTRVISELLHDLEARVNHGEHPDCIAATVLTDPEQKLSLRKYHLCSPSGASYTGFG